MSEPVEKQSGRAPLTGGQAAPKKLDETPVVRTPPPSHHVPAETIPQSNTAANAPIMPAYSPITEMSATTEIPPKQNNGGSRQDEVVILGSMPDQELLLRPRLLSHPSSLTFEFRWLIFSADDGYKHTQYSQFTITNTEEAASIAFRMRLRASSFICILVLFCPFRIVTFRFSAIATDSWNPCKVLT